MEHPRPEISASKAQKLTAVITTMMTSRARAPWRQFGEMSSQSFANFRKKHLLYLEENEIKRK